MKNRFIPIAVLTAFLFAFVGCTKEIDPEHLIGISFTNQTSHEVTAVLRGRNLFSSTVAVVIPAKSASTVPCVDNFMLDSCTFVFEDGKAVYYSDKSDGSPLNPVWFGGYEMIERTDPKSEYECLFCFTIVEDHYTSAR